jgi:hypothetical protein
LVYFSVLPDLFGRFRDQQTPRVGIEPATHALKGR